MSIPDNIRNHQRILLTGKRSIDILTICTKVMQHHRKPFDVLSPDANEIGNAPVVFIQALDNFDRYEPHIVLVDEVDMIERKTFESLADGLPKAGTLVYNTTNSIANAICSTPRTDVYREEYKDTSVNAAAMAVLRRLGISDKHFAEAL